MADDEATFFDGRWYTKSSAGNVPPALDISALVSSVTNLSRKIPSSIDVRDFALGSLNDGNIDATIDAAHAAAVGLTSGVGLTGPGVELKVPRGNWMLSQPHVFPAPGQYQIAVSLAGAGMNETVFRVATDVGHTPVFTFGTYDAAPSPLPHTFYVHVSGFSIIGVNGDGPCNRIGLRFYGPVNPLIYDIRVRGLRDQSCQWFEGHAVQFLECMSNGENVNSQFPEFRDSDLYGCQVGIYCTQAGPINIHNVHAQGMRLHAAILEGVSGTWSSSGIQNNFVGVDPDAWYGNRFVPVIVSGWNSTAGLPSGTGATCAAQSGYLSTVTGLSGLDTDRAQRGGGHEDMYLELTPAGASANELKVRGVYKIERVLSATSCTIRKGSTHTSQSGLSWQVRQGKYVNSVKIDSVYNEADGSKALIGMYRCAGGGRSSVVLKSPFFSSSGSGGSSYVEARSCNSVEIAEVVQRTNTPQYAADLTRVGESKIEALKSRVKVDDVSYHGLRCLSSWRAVPLLNDPGIPTLGWKDRMGGTAVRLGTALDQMGFLERWDTRVLSSINVVATKAQSITGRINGLSLGPRNAGVYPNYDDGDAIFKSPCIANVPGSGAAGGSMIGTIPHALLPTDRRFSMTMVVVCRFESATPGPADPLRVQLQQSGGGVYFIGFNDGQYYPSGTYCAMSGGNPAQFVGTPDTAPHVFVFSSTPQENNATSADFGANDWNRTGSHPFEAMLPGINIDVFVGGAGVHTYAFRWAMVAVKVGPISPAEHRKIVDCARNEWPLQQGT